MTVSPTARPGPPPAAAAAEAAAGAAGVAAIHTVAMMSDNYSYLIVDRSAGTNPP